MTAGTTWSQTKEHADAIGADGYSDNAGGAVALARRLIASSRE